MRITLLVSFLLCYYCIYITHASPNCVCLEDQQSLLLQFKNNLTYDPETSLTLKFWNNNTACCNWIGVTCDNEGHVIGLSLRGESISGGFDDSSSLFSLQHILKLDLSRNNFNSSIPLAFSKLEKLIELYLSGSQFYGTLSNSSSLFSLQNLETLDLAYNNFNSSFPSGFGKLEKLNYLDLSNCQFYGTIFNSNSLFSLQHLDTLHLSYNNFNSPIPSGFSKLEKLTGLYLSDCHFYGTLSNSMSNLTHLLYLDLSHNDLSGAIPSFLFTLPSLLQIYLYNNQFSKLDEFFNVSSSRLRNLDFSNNYISGPFPISIFHLKSLSELDLSFNKFNGSLHLDKFFELKNLTELDISYNKLFLNENAINIEPFSFPSFYNLGLASCNLKSIPSFLINQSTVSLLDLSDNQIQGVVPNWIWKLESLTELNISHNFFTKLEGPLQNLTSNFLRSVDLHNNQLQGPLPVFERQPYFLDYSMNRFSSAIPQDIGNYLYFINFLSLSNNNLHGSIPNSLCQASDLLLLDLSFNNFSGSIPSCLMTMSKYLVVLNLRSNNLQGPIPDKFLASCALQTFNLNGNLLDGKVPKSLAHCSKLEVLDIGTNQIDGRFPCFLQNLSTLSVLVLRNNKFHGTLGCSKAKSPWKMIQIVDIAFNNFSGKLPEKYFRAWKKMKDDDNAESDIIRSAINDIYYQDSVTVMSKGQQMELVKILTIFTAIDFSSNHFEGKIPEDLMDLKALYILNLSNNAFSNEIPSTIGNLKQLESLDLSNNSLVGKIPMQLASLSFLSYLNLSFNHLVGKIPTGTQLQSFEASSFEGNYGLYGPPLTEIPKRPDNPPSQPACGRLACSIDWSFLSVELGFVFGLGIIIGPIMFWKQWRVRYWKLVDKILCWMFSRMYLEYATDRGQTYTVLRW